MADTGGAWEHYTMADTGGAWEHYTMADTGGAQEHYTMADGTQISLKISLYMYCASKQHCQYSEIACFFI